MPPCQGKGGPYRKSVIGHDPHKRNGSIAALKITRMYTLGLAAAARSDPATHEEFPFLLLRSGDVAIAPPPVFPHRGGAPVRPRPRADPDVTRERRNGTRATGAGKRGRRCRTEKPGR